MSTDDILRRMSVAGAHFVRGDHSAGTDVLYVLVAALREEATREPDVVSRERVRMVMANDFAARRGAEHVSKPIGRVLVEMAGRVED